MPDETTPETIAILARQASLNLPPHIQAELVSAYSNVQRMLAGIQTARPRGDEPAHVFLPTSFQAKGK